MTEAERITLIGRLEYPTPALPHHAKEAAALIRSQAAQIETLHLVNVDHIEQRCKYVREIERLREALIKISRTEYHIDSPPIMSLDEIMRRMARTALGTIND